MYLGRLKRDKGILDLVDAFLKIDDGKNALLYLVGDDEENLIKSIKLSSDFIFHTIIDQKI